MSNGFENTIVHTYAVSPRQITNKLVFTDVSFLAVEKWDSSLPCLEFLRHACLAHSLVFRSHLLHLICLQVSHTSFDGYNLCSAPSPRT
jgi:hypothetical protein